MESQFHSIPEVSQAFDEAVPLLFLGAGIEVVGAEVWYVVPCFSV